MATRIERLGAAAVIHTDHGLLYLLYRSQFIPCIYIHGTASKMRFLEQIVANPSGFIELGSY